MTAAGVAERVELRAAELTELDEADRYDFAQLPVMLTSPTGMAEAPERIFRALRPGGWLLTMPLPRTGDELDDAVVRWRVSQQGGTVAFPDDLERRLRGCGFDPVLALTGLPVPLVAARRPATTG